MNNHFLIFLYLTVDQTSDIPIFHRTKSFEICDRVAYMPVFRYTDFLLLVILIEIRISHLLAVGVQIHKF